MPNYGVQTQRGINNYKISTVKMYDYPDFIIAFAYVKKAAALANAEAGALDSHIAQAIAAAADEVIAGKLWDNFPIDMMQGGAGTSVNMNANEVLANRALEIMGYEKGDYKHCYPNDHVNCGQSTNDRLSHRHTLCHHPYEQDARGEPEEPHCRLQAEGQRV
jgi:aspartate ammonia-lyase